MKNIHSQRGAVAIYMALLIITIITSAALALSGILARQARLSFQIVNNERAFYAADSGVEAVLFQLKSKIDVGDTSLSQAQDKLDYNGQPATFTAQGALTTTADQSRTIACVDSTGAFASESRRVAIGSGNCPF